MGPARPIGRYGWVGDVEMRNALEAPLVDAGRRLPSDAAWWSAILPMASPGSQVWRVAIVGLAGSRRNGVYGE